MDRSVILEYEMLIILVLVFVLGSKNETSFEVSIERIKTLC